MHVCACECVHECVTVCVCECVNLAESMVQKRHNIIQLMYLVTF